MLPQSEWLPQAQRLSVGMRLRVVHGRERTPAMTVANERDRWWAYCQRCHEGAVLTKDHVLLSGAAAPPVVLSKPTDVRPVLGSDYEETVGRFLAGKGMMFPYLPPLSYSAQHKRLMIHDDAACWHGRDLTDRSSMKWLNYDQSKFVGLPGSVTVLTEDLFSMYKVRFALRDSGYAVCCTLGSAVQDASVLALKSCSTLVWAYDADPAGDNGFKQASKRMRVFGAQQVRARPPEGLDPKDMDCQDIRAMIQGALC